MCWVCRGHAAQCRNGAPAISGRDHAAPFGETRLSGIDFLAIADQRNNHGPAFMPRHDFQGMRGFAFGQMAFAALAIARCLRLIPGALRFVEEDDARFGSFRGIDHVMFKKAMHILQRRARGPFGCIKGLTTFGRSVTRQGLTQHRHQGDIAGKKGCAVFTQGAEY